MPNKKKDFVKRFENDEKYKKCQNKSILNI